MSVQARGRVEQAGGVSILRDHKRRIEILEALNGRVNTSNLFLTPDAPQSVKDGFTVVSFKSVQVNAPPYYVTDQGSATAVPTNIWPWMSIVTGDVAYNNGWRVQITGSVKRGEEPVPPKFGGQRLVLQVTSDFGSYGLTIADQEPTNPANVFYSGRGPITLESGSPYAANEVLRVQGGVGALNPPVLIRDGWYILQWVPAGFNSPRHYIPERLRSPDGIHDCQAGYEPCDLSIFDSGFMYYNLDLNKMKLWTGVGWEIMSSAP